MQNQGIRIKSRRAKIPNGTKFRQMARVMQNYAESRDFLTSIRVRDFVPVGISYQTQKSKIRSEMLVVFSNKKKNQKTNKKTNANTHFKAKIWSSSPSLKKKKEKKH